MRSHAKALGLRRNSYCTALHKTWNAVQSYYLWVTSCYPWVTSCYPWVISLCNAVQSLCNAVISCYLWVTSLWNAVQSAAIDYSTTLTVQNIRETAKVFLCANRSFGASFYTTRGRFIEEMALSKLAQSINLREIEESLSSSFGDLLQYHFISCDKPYEWYKTTLQMNDLRTKRLLLFLVCFVWALSNNQ